MTERGHAPHEAGAPDDAAPGRSPPPPLLLPLRRTRTRRRGQGSGHVRRLPSGSWNGEVMLGYRERRVADGRVRLVRNVVSVTRRTRREVEAELARLRAAYDSGTLPQDVEARLTVGDLLDRWLREHVRVRRTAGTLRTYRSVVEAQLRPRVGDLPLRRLSTLRLVESLNALGDPPPGGGGYGPATVAKAWATLHGALTWAVRVHLLERHPLAGLEGPPKGEPAGRALSPREVARLRRAARRYKDGVWSPLVDLLCFTGLRIGEALSLRWGDVRLADPSGGANGAVAGELDVRVSKSRRGIRTVSLPDPAVAALRAQQERMGLTSPAERLAAQREGWYEPLPVFPSSTGRPYGTGRFQAEFREIVRRSGVPGRVVPRDLRHTWNATADRLRYGTRARAAHLGHTPEVNVGTYTHEEREVQARMAREVADELDQGAREEG